MNWIAPSEKDTNTAALEKQFWDAGGTASAALRMRRINRDLRHDHQTRSRTEAIELLPSSFILQPWLRLCRRNLAVHGLEGDLRTSACRLLHVRHSNFVIRHCPDPHDATGRFDFVLDNPPFNETFLGLQR